ncbi:MAG: hypothetical protein CSA22_01585 [Deltaproteobacteria bacterium]|nr:MAG: hypothetical protein CSA22_01585 [Deltaproteobacteria bacterium]
MFLVGITQETISESYLTLIKRDRKGLDRRFTVVSHDVLSADQSSPDPLIERLARLYTDPALILRSPQFNQNGRPTRRVSIPPMLLAYAPGAAWPEKLRDRQVPLDTFDIPVSADSPWSFKNVRPGLGRHIMVPGKDLLDCLSLAQQKESLIIPYAAQGAEALIASLSSTQQLGPQALSLLLPLWIEWKARFKVKVRYRG